MKSLEVEGGGHVLQCLIAGDATEYPVYTLLASVLTTVKAKSHVQSTG